MDAVTYPNRDVQRTLQDFFCFRVNTARTDPGTRRLLREYRLLWEPGLVVLESRGREIQRSVGFLPPPEFQSFLFLGLGKTALLYGKSGRAVERFRQAAAVSDSPERVPEALYWQGIARYRARKRDVNVLREEWESLRERYPDSDWWKKADVFDTVPQKQPQGGMGDE